MAQQGHPGGATHIVQVPLTAQEIRDEVISYRTLAQTTADYPNSYTILYLSIILKIERLVK